MQVVYVRKFHERDFVLRFGLDVIPFSEWAWSVIRGKDGGRQRHDDCVRGFHEFVWMEEVNRYVCFFCLAVEDIPSGEDDFDSEDERMIGPLKCKGCKKLGAKAVAGR